MPFVRIYAFNSASEQHIAERRTANNGRTKINTAKKVILTKIKIYDLIRERETNAGETQRNIRVVESFPAVRNMAPQSGINVFFRARAGN